jgi:hypothetical protein
VEITRCPYDASSIEPEPYSGSSTLLSCTTCGAAWEWNHTTLLRIREPDRDAVRFARSHEQVSVIRDAPNPALADAMWRQVPS